YPSDVGSQRLKLFFNTFVAAINMIDPIHQGCAVSNQAGNYQTGGCPQVTGHHWRALQALYPFNDRRVALKGNVGAHPVQFMNLNQAVLTHRFGDRPRAFCDRVHSGELGLHIGGKCGIRCSTQIDGFRTIALHIQLNPVFSGADMRTSFFKLQQHALEYSFAGIFDFDTTASGGGSNQIGAGFNTIGHHRVLTAVQPLHAMNHQRRRANTFNARTHRHQQIRQIDNLRLPGGVFQYCCAFRQRSGHQQVFRTTHGDNIHQDVCTLQTAVAAGADISFIDINNCTHGFQPAQVNVHRSTTDGAATGEGYVSHTEASQHWAQHQDGSAHGFYEFIGRRKVIDAVGINLHPHSLIYRDSDAHAAQQCEHGGDVVQMGHIAQQHRTVCQQGGGENWQCGVL